MNATETSRPTFVDALVAALEARAESERAQRMKEFHERKSERAQLEAKSEELQDKIATSTDRTDAMAAADELATAMKRRLKLAHMDFRMALDNAAERMMAMEDQIGENTELRREFDLLVSEYEECKAVGQRRYRNDRAHVTRFVKSLKAKVAARV